MTQNKTYGAQIKGLVEANEIVEANKLVDGLINAGVIVYSKNNDFYGDKRPMVCVNWGVEICLTDEEMDKGWFFYRDVDGIKNAVKPIMETIGVYGDFKFDYPDLYRGVLSVILTNASNYGQPNSKSDFHKTGEITLPASVLKTMVYENPSNATLLNPDEPVTLGYKLMPLFNDALQFQFSDGSYGYPLADVEL